MDDGWGQGEGEWKEREGKGVVKYGGNGSDQGWCDGED